LVRIADQCGRARRDTERVGGELQRQGARLFFRKAVAADEELEPVANTRLQE
jgi:hypothetical protein